MVETEMKLRLSKQLINIKQERDYVLGKDFVKDRVEKK